MSGKVQKGKTQKPRRPDSKLPENDVKPAFPTIRRTREIERIAALLGQPPADAAPPSDAQPTANERSKPSTSDSTKSSTPSILQLSSQSRFPDQKETISSGQENPDEVPHQISRLIESLLAMIERAGNSRIDALHETRALLSAPNPGGARACSAFIQQNGVPMMVQVLRSDEDRTRQAAAQILKCVVDHGHQDSLMACPAWYTSVFRLLSTTTKVDTHTAAASLLSVMTPTKECEQMVDYLIPLLREDSQRAREAGVRALVCLSRNADCLLAMEAGNEIEELLHHFESNTCQEVRIGCSELLATLAKSSGRGKLIIVGHDGVRALITYLNREIPVTIVHNCLAALQALSFDTRGLRTMKNYDILDRLADIVRNRKGDFLGETKHLAIQTMTIINKNLAKTRKTNMASTRPIGSLVQQQDVLGFSCLFSKLGTVFISRVIRRVCKAWRAAAALSLTWRTLRLPKAAFLTDEKLQLFLKKTDLAQVRDATVSGAVHLSADSMRQITNALCGGLSSVNLSDCPTLNDAALLQLMKSGEEKLGCVDISGCTALTNQSVFSMAWHLKHTLQELYLNRCSWLRDDAVLLISGGCRRLSKLGLSECVNITQEGLSGIKFCLALTELDISMNDFVTDETVRQLVDALPQLAAIDLSACEHLTDDGVLHLSRLPNLESVDLSSNMTLTDEAVAALAHSSPSLISIRCMLVPAVANQTMQALGTTCAELQVLDLSYAALIGDIGLRMVLRCCPRIAELQLAWCDSLSAKGLRYVAEFCRMLEVLNLSRCVLDDDVLLAIANGCRKLASATLVDCPIITHHGVHAFIEAADAKALKKLDLRGTIVEDRSQASRKLSKLIAASRHVHVLSGPI